MDASSTELGFMAAFAISGSVVLIARQFHKRLVSDFMKKIEFELGGSKRCQGKKKVRFAEDVIEPSSNNKEYRRRHMIRATKIHHYNLHKEMEIMPLNRQVLYKAIMESRCLKGYDI